MVFKGKHGVIYEKINVFMLNDSDVVQHLTVERIYPNQSVFSPPAIKNLVNEFPARNMMSDNGII